MEPSISSANPYGVKPTETTVSNIPTANVHQTTISTNSASSLPPEAATFEQIEEAAQTQSRFLKVQPGQTVILQFDPKKMQLVDRKIEERKSKAVQYTVINVNDQQEKILTLSLSWSLNLNELLKAGYRVIKVSRRGSGLDTSYNFIPV
jgi:hypothetical protein